MKFTKKYINEIKDIVMTNLYVDSYNMEDVFKEVIINDDSRAAIDIEFYVNDKDESFNYDLDKVSKLAFVVLKDEILNWLIPLRYKFLKYYKTYYSDLGFISITISLDTNKNELTYFIDLLKCYSFSDETKDNENENFTEEFTTHVNNYFIDILLKQKCEM